MVQTALLQLPILPRHCVLLIVRHAVFMVAAEREKLRRWRQSQGWDEERIFTAVQTLKKRQHDNEHEELGKNPHFVEMGGVHYFVVRFFNHVHQVGGWVWVL